MRPNDSRMGGVSIKLLIILIGIVLGAAAIGITVVSIPASQLSPAGGTTPPQEDGKDPTAPEAPVTAKPTVMKIDPLVVNLKGSGGHLFLKIEVALELRGSDVEMVLSDDIKRAQLSDILITYLSGMTWEDVDGPEKKEILRRQLQDKLNLDLDLDSGIVRIYFTTFVVMPQ